MVSLVLKSFQINSFTIFTIEQKYLHVQQICAPNFLKCTYSCSNDNLSVANQGTDFTDLPTHECSRPPTPHRKPPLECFKDSSIIPPWPLPQINQLALFNAGVVIFPRYEFWVPNLTAWGKNRQSEIKLSDIIMVLQYFLLGVYFQLLHSARCVLKLGSSQLCCQLVPAIT